MQINVPLQAQLSSSGRALEGTPIGDPLDALVSMRLQMTNHKYLAHSFIHSFR